ncbi:Putative protein of unknown function [Podospora comata]|uniref:Uncharacterized protein n=1 Tax=Podospora comata TaxID=48703 RepID=A0ABY6SH70_PODCO|nr:Putative protein of unknown function [Podospora comata]
MAEKNKMHPQGESLFFRRLPQEMRDHIWTQLFCSTRFTFGLWEGPDSRDCKHIKPTPSGLAMLRTCRRAQLEIGDLWLRHVLFCFQDTKSMMDRLSVLPVDTLSKLRHLRVSDNALLELGDPDDGRYYLLTSYFKLLPGLQLDQLTVLGARLFSLSYDTLDDLIKDGNGWKTLRYISHSSKMLGYASGYGPYGPGLGGNPQYCRKSQPKHWQGVLEDRDGVASGPSATIYRAKEPAQYGSILDPNKRVIFEQKPHCGQDLQPNEFHEDPELMSGDEKKKELMVVVKRGTGVKYEERDSPLIEWDLRRDFPNMTWEEIFNHYLQEPGYPPYAEKEERKKKAFNLPIQEDFYKDVDEYVWSGYHLDERY